MITLNKTPKNPVIDATKGEVFIKGRKLRINYSQLYKDISYDIEVGVYDKFPLLKKDFVKICSKLKNLQHVINAIPLNSYDLKTLCDNDYIKF